jgi:replication factor A1
MCAPWVWGYQIVRGCTFAHVCVGALKSKATQHLTILLKGLPRDMVHRGRGRPRGQWQSISDMTRLWYLIRVSKKYGLDTRRFLMCFPHAWAHEESSHNGISIQLRQKTEDNCVFLVTQDQKVIAQLNLSQKLLKYLPEMDPASFPFIELTPADRMETGETSDQQIKDIDGRVRSVNLKAKVVGKSLPRCVFSRFGDALTLSTATISDGTGSLRMSLWNAEIDRVSIGDTVQINNGRVRTFRGELQVSLGRKGRLQVVENQSMQ